MQFIKMQGLGNDYVYVDCFRQPPPDDPSRLSTVISDRHFGVGSDGLILVEPSDRADARMRMFNADGSEAEMCGNGLRCVAKLVYDHGIARKPQLNIDTGRGILTVNLEIVDDQVVRVTVDMGEPMLAAAQIPTTLPGPEVIAAPFELFPNASGELVTEKLSVTCVSMGNPHAVFFCPELQNVPLERIGPLIETALCFPKRINVHFVQVHSRTEVTMRTWERGSGITLACGTGACAVCVAGVLTGSTDRQIVAHLPGGDLDLNWRKVDNHVLMTGPAVEVFRGDWPSAEKKLVGVGSVRR